MGTSPCEQLEHWLSLNKSSSFNKYSKTENKRVRLVGPTYFIRAMTNETIFLEFNSIMLISKVFRSYQVSHDAVVSSNADFDDGDF
jgi:hypothetical protein